MKIKLCGMYRDEDILYANEAKPDYIGFIINFPKSHRNITPDTAQRLRKDLAPDIKSVGVFVDSPPEVCAGIANAGIIDLIQLHGAEDREYIARLRAMTNAPIIKAVKVTENADLTQYDSADFLLLDSGTGSGKAFDHLLIKALKIPLPFFLAGGLTPDNIKDIPLDPLPFAVDLSSGIETDKIKDRSKMLSAVRAARLL